MDILDIFEKQRRLQFACYPDFMSINTREQRLQDNLKHIIHEVIEVERETNFKHWKQPTRTDWDNIKEELVDVFIFFMNACNEAHLTPAELIDMTIAKQKINEDRKMSGY